MVDASGHVIGLLQAAWPSEGHLRAGVGPIAGVLEALAEPLDGGLGRLFATLAPPPSAANSPAARRRAATGSPHGDAGATRPLDQRIEAALRSQPAQAPHPTAAPRVQIDLPPEGATVGDAAGAFLAGHASALQGIQPRFDLVIALDTSGSTLQPTGLDVDGDGTVGRAIERGPDQGKSHDPGDSVLAAEIRAAASVIGGLDPRTTRVALVGFSGEAETFDPALRRPPRVKRATVTVEPLTSDYDRILRGLGDLASRQASGLTHIAAGIDQCLLELLGLPGSLSAPDPESEKVVLFFTDGQPTLPVPGADGVNVRAVLAAAQRARRAGVRIHSFAIGPEALGGPASTVEMAAITHGVFTPVWEPGQLTRFVETLSFARLADLEVRNRTLGRAAYLARLHRDGSWDALVPLVPGRNEIEVRVRSEEGREAVASRMVRHEPGAPSPVVPAELVRKRGELLRGRLAALEHERLERMRKELVLEIEHQRRAAEQRAHEQLKVLEIEVEREPTSTPRP